ncbi:hypothetical protein [Pararhizobium antarcticum]|uniref:hypothetical protein n=1 Tax=Pararhizobium antarcticum TaxID=1798805 RepID=UPI001587EEB3|nr:hypothetical protein [Pararhizobium antarcticum]
MPARRLREADALADEISYDRALLSFEAAWLKATVSASPCICAWRVLKQTS